MNLTQAVFTVGNLYTHEEVYDQLGVGNAGGIRPATEKNGTTRRLVVMTAAPSAKIANENPYHDRIEGDVLVYTAAGLEGEQQFSGPNRRLLEQRENSFPIYGFYNIGSRRDRKLGQRRWKFLGLLQYLRHSLERQPDARGKVRDVLLFELMLHSSPNEVPVAHDREIAASLASTSKVLDDTDAMHSSRAKQVSLPPRTPREFNSEEVEDTRRKLLTVHPKQFEHLVKDALSRSGFEGVKVTRYSGDNGIDVEAHVGNGIWPLQGLFLQVQAKRWLHTVGRREVAELRGSLNPEASGAIVTTSFYSRGALAEATAPGRRPIVLINGLDFSSVVLNTGCAINVKCDTA